MLSSTFNSLRLIALLLLVIACPKISAQATGTVRGSVMDQTNRAPVPYATVAILNSTKGAVSDAQGNFVISNVPNGNYQIRASAVGYKAVMASITVSPGGTTTQDFSLPADVLNMQGVVVTGTISPIPKLESSVAISTITPMQLTQANPRSTTEVLRYVPGFTRVESSGGEVNENISVRGILGVEYVMFMEDGLPVFPTMHTFFMNADNLFRTDENIQTVEVVRGGNSALFGSNTPGAIINFINKTGGPTFSGVVKATGATQGLARYDFNINGPVSEDLRFNVGGFYRFDEGVRYPGFPGIHGGQIKGSLTKLLDNGYIRGSFKVINDVNQFILDLPFQNPDDPTFIPGFSKYGAFTTNEANNLVVPTPAGDLQFPLENGLKTNAYWLTGDVNFNFEGDWTLRNMAQIMGDAQEWNGIFTGQPINQNAYVDSLHIPGMVGYSLVYTNHFDVTGKKLPFDLSSNSGLAFVSPSQLVHVEKPLSAFQDQLQIQKTFFKKHTISAGLYFAHYTQTNHWYFSNILMDVRDNPRLLDLQIFRAADTLQYTYSGFSNFLSTYINGTGSTTVFSGMIGGSFELMNRLRLDIGYRLEGDSYVQDAENASSVALDNNSKTLFNNQVVWGNHTFRHFSRTITDWALSGGLNYRLTDNIAIYAQGSRAYKMPALDEFLVAGAQEQIDLFGNRRLVSYEGGLKFSEQEFAFSVNGFWEDLTNIVSQGFQVTNAATGEGVWVIQGNPDNKAYGAEIEISGTPIPGLNVLAVGTYTEAKNIEASGGAALTAGGIPKWVGNISANYNLMGLNIYADFHYVGARDLVNAIYSPALGRYTTYAEFQTLPAYNYMNVGLGYNLPHQNLSLSLDLLNVYQSIGLEEGNPRLPGIKATYFVARPILPRRLMASLRYQF